MGKAEGNIDLALPLAERDTLEPELLWALRAYPDVRVGPAVSAAAAPVVVAPPGEQPRLSSRYSGTEIAILQRWEPSALIDFYSRLRWVLYREAMQPPTTRNIVLWMKRPELPASSGAEDPLGDGVQTQSGVMVQ
jgi:hypothetical protein